MVIRGAPGVGKSALLDAAAEGFSARGWRVLRTDGTPSERRLPFAGLHKLLRPIMGLADQLQARPRDALSRVFGLIDGTAPGTFLLALAALDLLAEAALSAPVLVVAEDAHWLDRSTADVLAFVARRLESDPIVRCWRAAAMLTRDRSSTAGSPSCRCPRSTPTPLRCCWMRAVPS